MNLIVLAQADQQGGGGGMTSFFIMIALMFLIMYFLIIRPQKKEQKKRVEMLSLMKKNDHVLTSGGIYGVILSVKDNDVILKIDEQNNTKVRVAKSAIIHIEKEASAEAETKQLAEEKK